MAKIAWDLFSVMAMVTSAGLSAKAGRASATSKLPASRWRVMGGKSSGRAAGEPEDRLPALPRLRQAFRLDRGANLDYHAPANEKPSAGSGGEPTNGSERVLGTHTCRRPRRPMPVVAADPLTGNLSSRGGR